VSRRERITLSMSTSDAIVAMCDGNPGALSVCVQLMKEGPHGFFRVLYLDSLGIYGPRIWRLYKDVCRQDLAVMQALLEGSRLGKFPVAVLNHAIDNYGEGLDLAPYVAPEAEAPKAGGAA
jgi:hypothetical protein